MPSIHPGGTNSQKKIEFSAHPVHGRGEGVPARRADFFEAIVARAAPQPNPRPQHVWSRALAARCGATPLVERFMATFPPIRVAGREIGPVLSAVSACAAAAVRHFLGGPGFKML